MVSSNSNSNENKNSSFLHKRDCKSKKDEVALNRHKTTRPLSIPEPIVEVATVENDGRKKATSLICENDESTLTDSYSTGNNSEANTNKETLAINNDLLARNNSLTNIAQSVKWSSTHSLPVIREQYCCFSKWTACEKLLGAIIGVMAVIIIVLIVIIGVLAADHKSNSKSFSFGI